MSTLPEGSVEVSPSVEPLNYSPDDAATRLGVSRQTIYRLRHQGILTIHKFGRRSLITAKDIEKCQRQMLNRKLPRDIKGASV
jgi:excisionase family DNA binding protein